MANNRRVVSRVTRWNLLQTLAFVLLLLSALTTITRIVDVSRITSSLRNDKPQSVSSVPKPVQKTIGSVQKTDDPAQKSAGSITATIIPDDSTELTVEQLKTYRVKRSETPHVYKSIKLKQMCYAQRDMGVISAVLQAANNFCMEGGWVREKERTVSVEKATKVTLYQVSGGIISATFQNLMLDFVGVAINRPIKTMADDGGQHDPRFNFNKRLVNCVCDELSEYFRNLPGPKERRAQEIWLNRLMLLPKNDATMSTICSPNTTRSEWDFVNNPLKRPDNIETVVFNDPIILMPRKDDHNPFFQIANAFNAWFMLKALNWDVTKVHVIHLDAGYPTPINELHKALLTPNYELIDGRTLMGKRVHFRGNVLLAPYEDQGPMMRHLNDDEPCYDSELIKKFRAECLQVFNITPEVERELGGTKSRPMMVTIISRRPYGGRPMRRVWVNEAEVMASMEMEYKDLNVEFRSIDYVNLTLYNQMKFTVESDMIIAMHGAGLANVLWTRPMTTVVEIFPKHKTRWGYRNLCQFVGCDWHQFRGGRDVHGEIDESDKFIPYDEWMAFFRPFFQETYGAFNEQQAVLRGETS